MKAIIVNIKNKVLRSKKGFSLLELLITLAIFGILMVTTTRIITINLIVARKVKARTYAREETAFMLNVLKKDIRNAQPGVNLSNNVLRLDVIDESGSTRTYTWSNQGTSILRKEGNTVNYQTPSDIEFRDLDFNISCEEDNCLVQITVNAWTLGMPGDPGLVCSDNKQCVKKEVVVSTRNFKFD